MNEYRSKLKVQNVLFAIVAVALIAVQVLAYTGVITPVSDDGRFSSFWNGFIAGAAAGLSAILIVGIIINLVAMRNEKSLKKLYIKETDECTKLISQKGKSAATSVYLFVMLAAGIISGFFSPTVFFTIIACEVTLSVFAFIGKMYYCKKM